MCCSVQGLLLRKHRLSPRHILSYSQNAKKLSAIHRITALRTRRCMPYKAGKWDEDEDKVPQAAHIATSASIVIQSLSITAIIATSSQGICACVVPTRVDSLVEGDVVVVTAIMVVFVACGGPDDALATLAARATASSFVNTHIDSTSNTSCCIRSAAVLLVRRFLLGPVVIFRRFLGVMHSVTGVASLLSLSSLLSALPVLPLWLLWLTWSW